MADIIVNDIPPRNQFVAAGGQTVFTYVFPIFANTDLAVWYTPAGVPPNDVTQLLTYNVGYTVINNVPPSVGGTVTLTTPANVGDIVTIVRNMPDNRLDNYIDGGLFEATDVNTDFDRTVFMAQQNKMTNLNIGVTYNNSSTPVPVVDTILPILPANCFWQKNGSNTAIVAVQNAGGGGGAGGGVVLPTVLNSIAVFDGVNGIIESSGASVTPGGNIIGSTVLAGSVSVSGQGPLTLYNATNTFSVSFEAAGLAASTLYFVPPAYPTIAGQFLSSNLTGTQSWQSGTQVFNGTLTNAQVLGMYAAPFQLVAAPPAGFAYLVKSFYIEILFNVAAFAGGGAAILQYGNTIHGAGTNTITNGATSTIAAAFFTGAAANQFQVLYTILNIGTTAITNYTAKGLFLSNDTAAFTNAAGGTSTLNVSIEYYTVAMS